MEAKISSKNQIVIPKACRALLDTKAGDSVLLVAKGNVVLMMKRPANPAKALRGILKKKVHSEQLEQGRDEW